MDFNLSSIHQILPALVSLAVTPHKLFTEFFLSLSDLCGFLCIQHFPEGGLTELYVHLTDKMYENLKLESARPKLPTRPIRLETGTEIQFSNYKEDLKTYENVCAAMTFLRAQTIQAVGDTIRTELSTLPGGVGRLSLADILKFIESKYGKLTEVDLDQVHDDLKTKFTTLDAFRAEAPRLKLKFLKLAANNQPISNHMQIKFLEKATNHIPSIVKAINKYKSDTTHSNRKFDKLVEDIIKFAPLSVGLADVMPSGSLNAAIVPVPPIADSSVPTDAEIAHAYNTLAAAGKLPAGGRGSGRGAGGGRGSGRGSGRGAALGGRGGRGAAPVAQSPAVPATVEPYCFEHGYHGHTGLQCHTMRKNSDYTKEMKEATFPQIIGGYQGNSSRG